MTKVSIIVPCYKQAEYLSDTLNSVLSQTYQEWECIIVNDGSPDNTEEVAREQVAKDTRFKYVWKKNEGVSAARNYGIMKSNGEFILPLDADDIIDSSYIAKAVERFITCPATKLVYCKADTFGEKEEYWDLGKYDYSRLIWRNIIFCTAMFRRSDYNKTNGYNPNMIYGHEDWDFWLSLLKENDIVYQIDDILFHYRIKKKSRTTELVNNHYQDATIQLCKNHPEIYLPYYEMVIINHNQAVDEIEFLRMELQKTRSSHAYRLGKYLLKPLSWIKKRCFL